MKTEFIHQHLEEFIKHHVNREKETVWSCLFEPRDQTANKCKVFRSYAFVKKHILIKHKKVLDKAQKAITEKAFRENYVEFFLNSNIKSEKFREKKSHDRKLIRNPMELRSSSLRLNSESNSEIPYTLI